VVPPVVAPPVAAPSEHAAEPESANPQASVPQLMHQLGATVVEAGTAVNYTADLLFDGTTDALHGDAAGRLTALARLIRQTHPSAVHISAADPGDGGLAERRAQVVANWLKDHAVTQPITATSATGSDAAVVVLLAR
jgi:outer membrane protein OmpA-like peptidoglycan-associated protein